MCLHRAACFASRRQSFEPIASCANDCYHRIPSAGRGSRKTRISTPSACSDQSTKSQAESIHSMTMRSLLRRIRRTPSSQSIQVGGACEDSAPQRQLRLSRTSAVLSKAIESTEESTRSRKRDRLRNFLTRRRGNLTRAFLWPDKDESRSSDGTEECDDVYMVDYHSDSDSDDDSLCGDNYVTPPVAIPELYRRQDRMGGIIVAGARVLFTFTGFKRQQMMLRRLQSVSETDELAIPVGLHREYIVIPAF